MDKGVLKIEVKYKWWEDSLLASPNLYTKRHSRVEHKMGGNLAEVVPVKWNLLLNKKLKSKVNCTQWWMGC